MGNIFVNRENASWIFDKIRLDYQSFTRHNLTNIESADVCWFLNPWEFKLRVGNIKSPSFVHIHHVDETKLREWSFDIINKYATGCIVPNKITEQVVAKYVDLPIYRFPYWVLSTAMVPRKESSIEKEDEILIGSFQKDSEGGTGKPKKSKGPDIFMDVVRNLHKKYKIKIVLTGYNRTYIINELEKERIPFLFYKRWDDINGLYDSLDWYFVTSRVEGGPQAVLEASYRKVKILSTYAGLAPEVLHPDCMCDNVEQFVDKFEKGLDRREENFTTVSGQYTPNVIVGRMDDFFEQRMK